MPLSLHAFWIRHEAASRFERSVCMQLRELVHIARSVQWTDATRSGTRAAASKTALRHLCRIYESVASLFEMHSRALSSF
jgi:hypothetical protein